jgi:hypothetical protein
MNLRLTRTIKNTKLPLNGYCSDIHSQNGEDGVIGEILIRLGTVIPISASCVEFGAWDGKYLSNTFALVEKGWSAVYIEADKDRFHDLIKTSRLHPNITAINVKVEHASNGENNLNEIFKAVKLRKNFEILSIDIDSYDLAVWESLQIFKPKIVIIEINSSYRPGLKRRHGENLAQGNSFTSTLEVALNKGYKLVCHTGNMIFVDAELFPLLKIPKPFTFNPNLLFTNYFLSQQDRAKNFLDIRQNIALNKLICYVKRY